MKNSNHWKLLADLNISIKTVAFLQNLGIDIKRIDKTVSTDDAVVNIAKQENRTILTFDKDFGEIYYFHQQKTFTVIVLSLEDQTAESVNSFLRQFFETVKFSAIKNKLIILYERRYRIIG